MAVGLITHPVCLNHDTGEGHPERPQRLQVILNHLRATKLWPQLTHLAAEPADRATLELVHSRPYIEEVERACRNGPTALDPDTIVSPGSWEAALRATGAAVQAVDRVMTGVLSSAFCVVRPPGHHAMPHRAMGFCLFNNVAIAASHALTTHRLARLPRARHLAGRDRPARRLARVLIVDWDVHHGNGTQAVFYDDPRVLYFSTHQEPCYPGTGQRRETGRGPGEGSTINVPLPAGSGDVEVVRAFEEFLIPAATRFAPELVLISAGFDAHRDDPLAALDVTEDGYARLTRLVRQIADAHCSGRIVSVLEGGYNLRALAASVEAHLRALMTLNF